MGTQHSRYSRCNDLSALTADIRVAAVELKAILETIYISSWTLHKLHWWYNGLASYPENESCAFVYRSVQELLFLLLLIFGHVVAPRTTV